MIVWKMPWHVGGWWTGMCVVVVVVVVGST